MKKHIWKLRWNKWMSVNNNRLHNLNKTQIISWVITTVKTKLMITIE